MLGVNKTMKTNGWDLSPGDKIKRTELHARQDLLDFLDSYSIAVIAPRQDGRFERVSRWDGRQAAD